MSLSHLSLYFFFLYFLCQFITSLLFWVALVLGVFSLLARQNLFKTRASRALLWTWAFFMILGLILHLLF